MDSDIPKQAASVKTQMIQVINDFSQYLVFQKQNKNTFLNLSTESEAVIHNWGIKKPIETFFFEGPQNATVFIIDSDGHFFKGEEGRLLVKILKAMNLDPDAVFICNAGDLESIHNKIKTICPEMIITLGAKAGQSLLQINLPLEEFRGKFYRVNKIKVMPTFHPALLLEKPAYKRQVWEDMKRVMENLGK